MSSTKPPGEEDVTTFSGFGSWMSTFEPQPAPTYQEEDNQQYKIHQQHVFHELDSHQYAYHELDDNSIAVAEKKNHVAELQDKHWKPPYPPDPVPAPAPAPSPIYNPVYQPMYGPGPYAKYNPSPQPIYNPNPPPQPPPVINRKNPLEIRKVVLEDVPDPVCRIEVKGLQKVGQKGVFTETVSLSSYGFLDDIARKLGSFGYRIPLGFATDHKNARMLSVPIGKKESPWPIVVTTGKPCYDPDIGLRIHMDEPFSNFLAKIQLSVKCADSRIFVNGGDLDIAFHRTLRVPEDGRTHKLPASFGRFPVQNIAAYNKKLLGSKNASLLDMAKKGGIFFPIFQREAVWLSFAAPKDSEYKIRVFVGGVNVVTGKTWNDTSKSSYQPGNDENQDYVLVPPQEHLDGIAVGNGIVRQFIAMPIGSGYSIEKQITGKEDVGGLQLEITPQNGRLHFSYYGRGITWQDSEDSGPTTPRTYGLNPGAMLSMTRTGSLGKLPYLGGKVRKEQKKTLRELIDPLSKGLVPSTVAITALYPVSLQIKMPGTLMKHKITSPSLSPLETIETLIKETKYKGKDLSGFNLAHNEMLSKHESLLGAGLFDGALLTAFKNYKGDSTHSGAATHGRMSVPQQQYQGAPQQNTYMPPSSEFGPIFGDAPQSAFQGNLNPYSGHHVTGVGRPLEGAPAFQQSSPPATYSPPLMHAAPMPQQAAMPQQALPPQQRPPPQQSSPVQQSQEMFSMAPTQQQASPDHHGLDLGYAPPGYPSFQSPSSQESSYGMPYQSYEGHGSPSSHSSPANYGPSSPTSTAQMSVGAPASPAAYHSPQEPYGRAYGAPAPTSAAPPSAYPAPTFPPAGSAPNRSYSSSAPSPSDNPGSTFQRMSPVTSPLTKPKPKPKPQETESWAMGLAAGGRLAQQIHLDPTPTAYRWEGPTATALISVQFLNAVAYETITGILCPPTPITAKQYTEAGIPWFDTYQSHAKSSSGGAAFDYVKSVSEIDSAGDILPGTSVATTQKVACTSCHRNLCDCILRPCNHAFCGGCVRERMLQFSYANATVIRCLVCQAISTQVLGFSAPMALPGQEEWLPDTGTDVVVKAGSFGKGIVFELE